MNPTPLFILNCNSIFPFVTGGEGPGIPRIFLITPSIHPNTGRACISGVLTVFCHIIIVCSVSHCNTETRPGSSRVNTRSLLLVSLPLNNANDKYQGIMIILPSREFLPPQLSSASARRRSAGENIGAGQQCRYQAFWFSPCEKHSGSEHDIPSTTLARATSRLKQRIRINWTSKYF